MGTFSSGSSVLGAGKGQLRAGARPTTPPALPGLLQKKAPGALEWEELGQ